MYSAAGILLRLSARCISLSSLLHVFISLSSFFIINMECGVFGPGAAEAEGYGYVTHLAGYLHGYNEIVTCPYWNFLRYSNIFFFLPCRAFPEVVSISHLGSLPSRCCGKIRISSRETCCTMTGETVHLHLRVICARLVMLHGAIPWDEWRSRSASVTDLRIRCPHADR